MNRKQSFIVFVAVLAVALVLSASVAVAREPAPPDEAAAPAQVSQCQASLPDARVRLLGRVFDANAQGAAREGWRVQAVGPNGAVWGETPVQANGQYVFRALPAGQYTLRVLDERGRPQPTDQAEVVLTEAQSQAEYDLLLAVLQGTFGPAGVQATGQITGVVTAAGTGLPIANVDVTVYDAATQSYQGSDTTDSSGQYTIGGLATGAYQVKFNAPYGSLYLTQWYNNKTGQSSATSVNVTDGIATANINAMLQVGGQITGKVTAADTHNPLQDVDVSVSGSFSGTGCSNYWSGSATTNAAGVYTVTGVPTGSSYRIEFDPSSYGFAKDYVWQYYSNTTSWSQATLVGVTAPNVVTGIDAALLKGGQITGRVTGQGGAGLDEVYVSANGWDYVSADTDATGAYTITGLMSGTYQVKFSPSAYGVSKDYAYQYYNTKSTGATADDVQVTAPNVTPNINQQLPLGSRITGHVTAGGSPMSSASIQVYDSEDSYVTSASTNASGVYTTTPLPTGSYRVQFQPRSSQQATYTWQYYNGKSTLAAADVLAVTAPTPVSNIDAALAQGGRISGTVKAADTSLPLKGVSVYIYDSNGSYVTSVASDATGAYATVALPPGGYRVRFLSTTIYNADCSAKCYAGQYYNNKSSLGSADAVNVVASQVTQNINATLAACSTGPTPPDSVSLAGTASGLPGTAHTFTATVSPGSASTPITYTWQADGQTLVTHTGRGTSDTIQFTWSTTGTKAITVTATNAGGTATNSRTILINETGTVTPPSGVMLSGPVTGTAYTSITFSAAVSPADATTPLTYVWQATGRAPMTRTNGLSDSVTMMWTSSVTSTQSVTVTATNAGGWAAASRSITIYPSSIVFDHWIFLPVVMRQ